MEKMKDKYKLVADYNLWVMQTGNEDTDITAIHDSEGKFLFDVLEDDYLEMLDLDLVECGYLLASHTADEIAEYQKRWGVLWTDKVTEEQLEQMKRLPQVTEPEEMEFYSIEPDGKGGKQIHVWGYCYTEGDDQGEGPWRNVEYTFFIEPLQEFIDHLKQNENYVDDTAADVKQYIGDYTDEGMADVINHYFNGHTANRRLHYSEITIDTPCGDYIA